MCLSLGCYPFFPETEFYDDVSAFGIEQVQALALQYSNVGLVLGQWIER